MPALVVGWRCQRHSRRTLASVQRPHVLTHWPSRCVSPAWCCRAKSGRVQQSRGTDDTRPQVPHCHTGRCRCRGYLSWYMNSWPHIALSPLHASHAEWPNGLPGDLLLFLALRQLPSVDQGRRQHPSALMPHWGSCRKIDRFADPFFLATTVSGPQRRVDASPRIGQDRRRDRCRPCCGRDMERRESYGWPQEVTHDDSC